MRTMERTTDEPAAESTTPRGRTRFRFGAATVVIIIVATTLVTYVIAPGKTRTRVVVRQSPASSSPPDRSCVPGAATGSCNTDEAAERVPDVPLDAATRALLAQQLLEARAAALRYPTVADATRAGMVQAGEFSPGTGAHYLAPGAQVLQFDAAHPGSYMYDGTDPTSKVVGVMYMSLSVPLASFAGPNDHWHRHSNTCFTTAAGKVVTLFATDADVTTSQCAARHGTFLRESTWMVHAWVVPGWESPQGVFSHENPDLLCADGSAKADAIGFCKGT